jgi:hypothetical protein
MARFFRAPTATHTGGAVGILVGRRFLLLLVVSACATGSIDLSDNPGGGPSTQGGDADVLSGDSASAPGDSAIAPGDFAPTPGDSAPAPGDSAPTPGDDAPLPGDSTPQSHAPAVHFGYYRVDLVPSGGQSYAQTVAPFANLAYVDWYADARAFDYEEGAPMGQVKQNMAGMLERVTAAGLDVIMDVAYGNAWGPRLTKQGIFNTAAPYWDRIKYVILGDELSMSRDEAEAVIVELRNGIAGAGLAARPIGVTLTPDFVLGSPDILNASWDFISIEAYTQVCSCGNCGNGTPEAEAAAVVSHIHQQEAIIPADKRLVLVLQGYDRNGAFANTPALVAINRASYFDIVKDNPRYLAMVAFNWQREGSTCAQNPAPTYGHGTSGYPQLQAVHREIWNDLTGQ